MKPDTHPVKIYNDRAELRSLPAEIRALLDENGLVTSGREQKAAFCGLLQQPEVSCIFLPRNMRTDRQHLPAFFSALRKYSGHSEKMIRDDSTGESLTGGDDLQMISDLLDDYRTYGIYSRRNRTIRINDGKPNWPRTISKFKPAVTSGGPVYLDYIGSNTKNQCDSEASRIHAFVIRSLDARYGEIFMGRKSYIDDGLPPPKNLAKEYFISVLHSELQKLYSERDIRLFKNLIQYVRKRWGDDKSSMVVGVSGFHTVWEHMLLSVTEGVVDVNREFSIPTYVTLHNDHIKASNKRARTDLIVHDPKGNVYSVADAKYYDARGIQSAPGWGDLLKQFFYAQALKSLRPEAEVRNFFIFPGTEPHFTRAYMQQHGEGKEDPLYENITCLYVNPATVIRAYVDNTKLQELSIILVT